MIGKVLYRNHDFRLGPNNIFLHIICSRAKLVKTVKANIIQNFHRLPNSYTFDNHNGGEGTVHYLYVRAGNCEKSTHVY